LALLAGHGHPSVAAMARALLAGAPVVYNGDPLRDLSLTAFLDGFVQKKPKVGGSCPVAASAQRLLDRTHICNCSHDGCLPDRRGNVL
jgi:hypothetical protein